VRDVTLTRILRADLVFIGELDSTLQSDRSSWAFRGTGRNRGDGCAGGISGQTTFTAPGGAAIGTLSWSLPASVIVRPGATFLYEICCIRVDRIRDGGSYVTAFDFQTAPCPSQSD
jgi:hypothetical protein